MPAGSTSPLDVFKQALAVAIKAIGRRDELELAFSDTPPDVQGKRVKLPQTGDNLETTNQALVRGAGDAAALRWRHHDEKLYRQTEPSDLAAQKLFSALEQARYEALGAQEMAGVAHNLAALMATRCDQKNMTGAVTLADVKMADALQLIAHELFTGAEVPEAGRQAVALWRPAIEAKAGAALHRLASLVDDQQAFAAASLELLAQLSAEPEDERPQADAAQNAQKSDENKPEDSDKAQKEEKRATETDDEERIDAGDTPNPDESEEEQEAQAEDFEIPTDLNVGPRTTYRVFTTAFDEEVAAEALCAPEELTRLRALLDQRVMQLQDTVVRLANRLQRLLMARQARSWQFDLEEGLLDAARLTRVIVDPLQPLSFKAEKETDFRDTVVSLLLDNSGSMRGRPITLAAISADILARTLERCGVKVEILGFTTRAWRGGRSRDLWLKSDKPPMPGRLNELRHIIYKAADVPWRRAHKNLGLLLREGLLKENIDGEALLWAAKRLMHRSEQRRILVVISDGAPVDDATLATNPSNYLEQHLRSVIDWLERSSALQLVAIGIGHDVTKYYRRAVTLTDADQLGSALVEQLAGLFGNDDSPAKKKREVR